MYFLITKHKLFSLFTTYGWLGVWGAAAAGLRIEFDYFVSIFSAKEYWQVP